MNKEPFEKRFEKFITSKINTLHKGNISRKELFVVFVSRTVCLPQLKTGKRDGMQSNISHGTHKLKHNWSAVFILQSSACAHVTN